MSIALCLLLSILQDPQPIPAPPAWQRQRLERSVLSPLRVLWHKDLQAPSFGAACFASGRVAFGTWFGDSRALMLCGTDGSEVWSRDFGDGQGRACLDASFRFAALKAENSLIATPALLVPVSSTGTLHALDFASGQTLWSYSAGDGDGIDSPAAFVDTDRDGLCDIVFGSFRGRLHVLDQQGRRLRHVRIGDGMVQTGPLVVDADRDGTADFVAGTFKGDNRLYCRSGSSGAEIWHLQLPTGGPTDLGIYHGPALGDLDQDGVPELVTTAYDGVVRCLRLRDGEELWRVVPGDRYFMSPPSIGDVDGDGKPEVITASQRVTVIDGRGTVRYSVPISPPDSHLAADRGAALADLDGDDRLDIAVLRADGWFGVLRGSSGELIFELPRQTVTPRPVLGCANGPVLADLDGDGALDAFYVLGNPSERQRFGIAVAVTGFFGKGPGWYMLQHDAQNTGNVATELAPLQRWRPPPVPK